MSDSPVDPRRQIPRTDTILELPPFVAAALRFGRPAVKDAVLRAQHAARHGLIEPTRVVDEALALLPHRAGALTPVINATGVVIHTNIGRAPLSDTAIEALTDAARYTDVEYDRTTGARGSRGEAAIEALRDAIPGAEAALVVNNGAAALALATAAFAAGREVIISRGELVEIGDGFRLPDLIEATGAHIHEVGTTNRTHLADYEHAVNQRTGAIVKIHPSNFEVTGFTSSVTISDLASLGVPVVADAGSGLLRPDPTLPTEPDLATCLAEGATLVTASGDKLLGGPQAGIIAGRADAVGQLRRHPLARAMRVDKLTLAALEATLRGPQPPATTYRHLTRDAIRARTTALAHALGMPVIDCVGRVGGGGAPGIELPGLAVALPAACATPLRLGDPTVVARVDNGRCLIDLRCVPETDDLAVIAAAQAALAATTSHALGER